MVGPQVDWDGRADEGVGAVDEDAQEDEGGGVEVEAGGGGLAPVQGAGVAREVVQEQL